MVKMIVVLFFCGCLWLLWKEGKVVWHKMQAEEGLDKVKMQEEVDDMVAETEMRFRILQEKKEKREHRLYEQDGQPSVEEQEM